jgi:hypothetical protein
VIKSREVCIDAIFSTNRKDEKLIRNLIPNICKNKQLEDVSVDMKLILEWVLRMI